ncbi:hypothetical protein B0H14DRAFT_3151879 [Mycena olivaceomarginata]|nr:hypothetical protein B0H14DRAFT_3151879 [Mycena olivaceomarginata]
MHLTLAPHKPINATYTDTESGVEQYKVHTEIKLHDSITTISRRIDSDVPRRDSQSEGNAIDGRFGLFAQIHWRIVGPTVIQFGGRELNAATFFRNRGLSLFGWQPGFTGLDGKEYRWRMTVNLTKLEVDDASATLVAEYKEKTLSVLGGAKEPSLEIFPSFEYMADEIIVTFVYLQKTRKS